MMKGAAMLTKPDAGWTYFQPTPNISYRLSYLTDVANTWLVQAIHGLKTLDVFSVHGFSEPGRMICTVSYWSCYVIFEGEEPRPSCDSVDHIHINMIEFCEKLHADIADNLEDWVHWDDDGILETYDAGTEKEAFAMRRNSLQEKLDELAALIRENKEDFDAETYFL